MRDRQDANARHGPTNHLRPVVENGNNLAIEPGEQASSSFI